MEKDSIVNYRTYVQTVTQFLKMLIHVNKGTTDEILLEKLLQHCNQFNNLCANKQLTDEDVKLIRVSLKRINMLLKINSDGSIINMKDKTAQLRILEFNPHPSILDGNLKNFLEHISKYNMDLFQGVPLQTILRETKYRDLLWHHTRSIFFITQIILTNNSTDTMKNSINNESLDNFTNVLEVIGLLEEQINLEKTTAMDEFLKSKIIRSGITEKTISSAKNEVKELFNKKGISGNNAMGKMIDSISSKLTDIDLANGNLIQTMMSIAQDVAGEMQNEVQGNPDGFKNTLGSVMEIFQETMQGSDADNSIPDELKTMFAGVKQVVDNRINGSDDNAEPDAELLANLETLANAQGVSTEELLNNLVNQDGQLDDQKLTDLFNNSNKN